MKSKTIISVALLAFVAVSVGWLVVKQGLGQSGPAEPTPAPREVPANPAPKPAVSPDRVIVYYLHTTYRCPTCRKIENYTREVVEQKFERELKDGRMEFHAINVDEQGNEHFVEDYKLHTKSVVVSDMKDGKEARWKNLEKVWELTGNKDNFFKYIEDEVNLYLQGK